MLPVTPHKTFHVPHSLAMLAALVALITAIGWATSGDNIDIAGSSSAPETPIDAAPEQLEQQPGDGAGRSARAGVAQCERSCDRDAPAELLPLVLPSLSRR